MICWAVCAGEPAAAAACRTALSAAAGPAGGHKESQRRGSNRRVPTTRWTAAPALSRPTGWRAQAWGIGRSVCWAGCWCDVKGAAKGLSVATSSSCCPAE